MEQNPDQERQQAHALLDLLPAEKLSVIRVLLRSMVDDRDDEELTDEDRAAIQEGLSSLEKHGSIPMEDILADFGLTMADFEKMTAAPTAKRNG